MYDVYREVISLAGIWHSFGCALRLRQSDLSTIAATYPSNPEACLKQVITKWLQKVYNVKRYGPPTWEKVVVALLDRAGGNNPDLANRISMKYISGDLLCFPVMVYLIVSSHNIKPDINKCSCSQFCSCAHEPFFSNSLI